MLLGSLCGCSMCVWHQLLPIISPAPPPSSYPWALPSWAPDHPDWFNMSMLFQVGVGNPELPLEHEQLQGRSPSLTIHGPWFPEPQVVTVTLGLLWLLVLCCSCPSLVEMGGRHLLKSCCSSMTWIEIGNDRSWQLVLRP